MAQIFRNQSLLLSKVCAFNLVCNELLIRCVGTVFDVTRKVDVYGKGKSYNLFAGKDASRALGKSSLSEEDAVSDYTVLPDNELKVLDEWEAFFM